MRELSMAQGGRPKSSPQFGCVSQIRNAQLQTHMRLRFVHLKMRVLRSSVVAVSACQGVLASRRHVVVVRPVACVQGAVAEVAGWRHAIAGGLGLHLIALLPGSYYVSGKKRTGRCAWVSRGLGPWRHQSYAR